MKAMKASSRRGAGNAVETLDLEDRTDFHKSDECCIYMDYSYARLPRRHAASVTPRNDKKDFRFFSVSPFHRFPVSSFSRLLAPDS